MGGPDMATPVASPDDYSSASESDESSSRRWPICPPINAGP